jgi:hypothetical protein
MEWMLLVSRVLLVVLLLAMVMLLLLLLTGCLLHCTGPRVATWHNVQRVASLLAISELSLRSGSNGSHIQSTSGNFASSWCVMMVGSSHCCSSYTVNSCISGRDSLHSLFVQVQNVWSQHSHKFSERFITKIAMQCIAKQIESLKRVVIGSQLAYGLGCGQLIEAQIQETQLQKAV